MPFKSKAQQRYLFANEPDVAKEFAKHTSKKQYKKMPEHVTKDKELKKEASNQDILKALAYTGGGGGLGALLGYALANRPLLGAGIGAGAGLGTYAAIERPFSNKPVETPTLKATPAAEPPRVAPVLKSVEQPTSMPLADKVEAAADAVAMGVEGNFWRKALKSGKYADLSMPATKGIISKALVPLKLGTKALGPAILPMQAGTDMFFDRNWKPSLNVPANLVDNARSTLDELRGESYSNPMTYVRGAINGLNIPRTVASTIVGLGEPALDSLINWQKRRALDKQEKAIDKRKMLSILSKQSSVATTGQQASSFGAADAFHTTLKGAKTVAGTANKAVTAANIAGKAAGSTIQPVANAASKVAPTLAGATAAMPKLTQAAAYAKPLTALYVGYNTAENMFKDPQTGEWNTNVAQNFSGNTENAIKEAGQVNPYGVGAVWNGVRQGGSNPIGTLSGTVKATSDIVTQGRENTQKTLTTANEIDTVNQRLAMHGKPLVPKEQQYAAAQPRQPAPQQTAQATPPAQKTTQAKDWRAFL